MINVEQNVLCGEIWRNVDKFLHMNNEKCGECLLCGDISPHLRCFVAKSVLSRFTPFCVENKFNQKLLVEKKDKYQVWFWDREGETHCPVTVNGLQPL